MRVENWKKILERLATSKKATIVIERPSEGKIRMTSGSWGQPKVVLRDQVLEIHSVDQRIHLAQKPPRHNEWGPPWAKATRKRLRGVRKC